MQGLLQGAIQQRIVLMACHKQRTSSLCIMHALPLNFGAFAQQVLVAVWRGWEVAGTGGCARDAAAAAYAECLAWAVCNGPKVFILPLMGNII